MKNMNNGDEQRGNNGRDAVSRHYDHAANARRQATPYIAYLGTTKTLSDSRLDQGHQVVGNYSLPGPLHGVLVVPGPVSLVQVGNLGGERVVRVRVRKKRANRQQH